MGVNGWSQEPDNLDVIARRAAIRRRIARAKRAVALAMIVLAAGAAFWMVTLRFFPSWITPFPAAAATAAIMLLGALMLGWLRRIDPKAIRHEIDQRLGLPDLALSASELTPDEHPQAWVEQQRRQTLEEITSRMGSRSWREISPAPWPKWSGLATLIVAVLFPLLAYLHSVHATISSVETNFPRETRRAAAMEELFKDWEQEEERLDGEEKAALRELLEKIAPIRERLVDPKADEREIFTELNRLEEILAAAKTALESESLEPHAAQLAAALEPVEGMSALAAALRRKDFENAERHAEKAEAQLSKEDAKVPAGAKEAGAKASKLSEELAKGNQPQAAQAMSQFCKGAQEGDPKKMGSGMKGLKESLSRQNTRNNEQRRLGTQLSQLGMFKKDLGEGKCPSMSQIPSLCKGNQPGKGIGTSTDPNLFGAETQMATNRTQESLSGEMSEGDSETTTQKSAHGDAEASRGPRDGTFQEYERLSRQAVEDENLPAAHRQTIKKYFERIRPEAELSTPPTLPR